MSRGTASRIIGRELTACIMLVCAAILTKSAHAEPLANSADVIPTDVSDVWSRFVAVNKVWLDPRPKRLSYVVVAAPKNGNDKIAKTTTRVWIDGDNLRSEQEIEDPQSVDKQEAARIIVCADGQVTYLQPPADALLNKPMPAGQIYPLRQGMLWYTAVHSAYHEGLPRDCRLVNREQVDGGEVVVLQMDLPQRHSSFGLGLYRIYLGGSSVRLDRVQLHIRLPDCVLVKEEFLDRQIMIEYDPKYLEFGESRAPSRVRYISRLANGKQWVLEGQFQKTQGEWLLDKALNIQDGKTIIEMRVSNVSTAAVDQSLFKLSANNAE